MLHLCHLWVFLNKPVQSDFVKNSIGGCKFSRKTDTQHRSKFSITSAKMRKPTPSLPLPGTFPDPFHLQPHGKFMGLRLASMCCLPSEIIERGNARRNFG